MVRAGQQKKKKFLCLLLFFADVLETSMMMTGPMFKLHVNAIWRTSPGTYALSMVSRQGERQKLIEYSQVRLSSN